uniref:protein-tyrosine-phosphatase n=3 Tax=Parascaris univalens TaxID=6257 RepID=A0A915A5R2_PARUN
MSFRPSNFYYPVSGIEAERLLNTYGSEGSFLARPSGSSPSDYTLSVHRGSKITHVKIQNNGDCLDLYGGDTFASLSELVQFCVENPCQLRERDGETITMKCPLVVPPTERIGWAVSRPMTERWFHTGISGREAERLLLAEGKHGTYLVRESQSTPGQFAVSVKASDDKVTHVMIYNNNNKFDIGGGATFCTIGELLEHYTRNPMVDQAGTVVHLKQPLPSTRVPATGIDDRFQRLELVDRLTGKDGFADEFEKLQHQEPSQFVSRREGKKTENVNKNRYKNIIPYDHTRIVLRTDSSVEGADYINANLIEILSKEYPEFTGLQRRYISTQGCLPNTVNDFWMMVWQQNSRIIVMTTKEVERARSKCCRYWPSKGERERYGRKQEFTVETIEEDEQSDYTMRVMQLSSSLPGDDNEVRLIWHFQFLAWPDHGCPSDPRTVLNFLEKVNECEAQNCFEVPAGPIIVHCSAGIGRTGTFIVIDILLNQIKRIGTHCQLDIPRTVQMVREQRSGMVQTEQQYRFLYQAVSCYVTSLNRKQDYERRERCGSRFSNHSGGTQTPVTPTPLTPLSTLSSPAVTSASSSFSSRTNDSERIYLNTSVGSTGVNTSAGSTVAAALKLAPPPLPKKKAAVVGNSTSFELHKAHLGDTYSSQ